jgi:hypothetical protein
VTALLLRVKLEAARASAGAAKKAYLELLDLLRKRRGLPEVYELVARATLLAEGLGEQKEGQDFLERLGNVSPPWAGGWNLELPSSRYAALRPFITTALQSEKSLTGEFKEALSEPGDSPDWFQHNLAFAAGCRFFGDMEGLERSLRQGTERASGNPYALFAIRSLIPEQLAFGLPAPAGYLAQWQAIEPNEPAHTALAYLEEAEKAFYREDFHTAEELLERYLALASVPRVVPPDSTLLPRPPLPRHQKWAWKALLLRARLEWRNGRNEEAAAHLREGISVASEMGNERAVRAFGQALQSGPTPSMWPIAQQPPPETEDECRISLASSGLNVEFRFTDGFTSTQVHTSPASPAASWIADSFRDLYPPLLVGPLSQSFPDLQRDLQNILAPRGRNFEAVRRLCLRIPLSAASPVPWEIAFPDERPFVYRAPSLPITQPPEWIAEFPGPPVVLVVQASKEGERYSKRGYGLTGLSVSEFYRRAGLRVETVTAEREGWTKALHQMSPAIIHIASPLGESRQPRDVLLATFDPRRQRAEMDTSESESPYASTLVSVFGSLRYVPRPLLILDTYWDPEDHARQVLLRNYFAASLFESALLRSILAVGDYPPDLMEHFLRTLTTELSRRPTVAELHARLLHETHPMLPPALFTCYPDMRAF